LLASPFFSQCGEFRRSYVYYFQGPKALHPESDTAFVDLLDDTLLIENSPASCCTLLKENSPASCRGGVLNFNVWSKMNLLFEPKEIKLYQKRHPMKNKTKITQHVLKMQ
jgi:hypothetical protein